jgi:hypothetical protein
VGVHHTTHAYNQQHARLCTKQHLISKFMIRIPRLVRRAVKVTNRDTRARGGDKSGGVGPSGIFCLMVYD